MRRRPEPAKFFGRFLEVDPALRGRMADAAVDAGWLDAPEDAIRQHLLDSLADDRAFVEAVLTSSQLEALDFGYRERVVDVHLPQIRDLPRTLPGLFADAGAPRPRGRLRRRRAALRPRLHDGLVPLAA